MTKQTPFFIGLGHYSRTGKDTFANAFIDYARDFYPMLRVKRRSFATKLKEVTHDLYAWAGLKDEAYYNTPEGEKHRDTPLAGLGGITPVDVWVRFGTTAIREQVYDATWVDYVLKSSEAYDIVIIPDVRFPNEVDAIRAHSGRLFKIVRPGVCPRDTVADQALVGFTGWDSTFGEEGCIHTLRSRAHTQAEIISQEVCGVVKDRPFTDNFDDLQCTYDATFLPPLGNFDLGESQDE